MYIQIKTGGLFLRPIPGHMLQTVETTPQVCTYVHVYIKWYLIIYQYCIQIIGIVKIIFLYVAMYN